MSGQGRGRGEGTFALEEESPSRVVPVSHGQGSELVVRGRGGYRATEELVTKPSNVATTVATCENDSRKLEVMANYVKIMPLPKETIYSYRVDFSPEIDSTRLRKQIFNQAYLEYFDSKQVFDGMFDARSLKKLPDDRLTSEVTDPNDPERKIKITLKRTGEVNWSSFEMIRFYNLHMKTFLDALGFFRISNKGAFVHPCLSCPIGSRGDIAIVRGYRTAASPHANDNVLMNLESVHKIMQQKNVLQLLMDCKKSGGDFREKAKLMLVNKLVVTNYKKIAYRVEDLNFDMTPMSTFKDKKSGQDVSYLEYMNRRHGITIHDRNQPMILAVQSTNKRMREQEESNDIYLVPELCNIAGLTNEQANDMRLKIDLIRASQVSPQDRVANMKTFLNEFHNNTKVKEMLNKWGYSYGTEPVNVPARILAAEPVGVGKMASGSAKEWPKIDHMGSFEQIVVRDSLAVPPKFTKMAILVPRPLSGAQSEIIGKLKNAFGKIKLIPSQVQEICMVQGDSAQNYVQYLRNLESDVTAALVLLPSQHKDKYNAIKKVASCEKGLITQVITGKLMTDQRKASGAAVKIGIQVAAKIGGEPWYMNLPLKGAMVCGYDTYHDTANRGRSFGAFVASMNDKYTRWFSRADGHDKLEELSSHLMENLIQAMRKYKEINEKFPERVFIYRDGVGEGQLDHVYNVELEQIRNALRESGAEVRLTVIIVNKRVGARFFMKGQDGKFSNCPPGTVIDDVVTRRERYDFYLVSQSTRAGTVSPTYYNIICDESGLKAQHHQAMAYKFCFLYFNWTGSVRVPAPCQYAHKLALLCGEHLHAVPNSCLDDKLHYL